MKWRILCANPVKPEDWELVYNKSIHYGELSTKLYINSGVIIFRRYF